MKIRNITKIENQSACYDIQTSTKNFFANGILVHNSMIHTVNTSNGILLKSKKTFESDVAIAAFNWVQLPENKNYQEFIEFTVNELHSTIIFEWTAPDARIVLLYTQPELYVLHIRNNLTGEYMTPAELNVLTKRFNVKLVSEVNDYWVNNSIDYERLLLDAKTKEGIEGWVLQFENGDMVKLKTDWYLKRHRAMTFLRERDIAQLVLDEGLDDIKSMLVGEGVNISEIIQLEQQVLHDLRQIVIQVEFDVEQDKHLDRKTFALKYKDSEFFGLKMMKFSGKEPNYKEYFERNILKDKYSLRQLVLIATTAEME